MNPPLLEVSLQLHFESAQFTEERLQYFYRLVGDLLPDSKKMPNQVACYTSIDKSSSLVLNRQLLELRSSAGISYPRLRSDWNRILSSFGDSFEVPEVQNVSLSYLNEIPLQDLQSFQNYLNISFAMPEPLEKRFEFFRSEFTYKYDFGEIKVWLQPDWDDELENYCLQLNLQSLQSGTVSTSALSTQLQELHDGMKDVFHQILSENFISQLPQ
jgi:uncharacterized protein (TIGR04255 family)